MKNILLLLLFTLPFFCNSESILSDRPESQKVKSIFFEAEIIDFETVNSMILTTKLTEDIKNFILINELSRKNIGIVGKGDNKSYVLRVMLYGVKENSDIEVVRELFKAKKFRLGCHSIVTNHDGYIPACQIILNDTNDEVTDAVLHYAQKAEYSNRLFISTRLINHDIELHTSYEKVIGNLLILQF